MYLYAICLLWASYILKVFNTLLRSTKAIVFRHVLKTHGRWPACYYNKIIGWWWALNDLWHFDIQKIQGHLAIIHVYRSMTVNLTFDLLILKFIGFIHFSYIHLSDCRAWICQWKKKKKKKGENPKIAAQCLRNYYSFEWCNNQSLFFMKCKHMDL